MPPKSLVKYIPDQSPTTIPFNDNELINSTINSLKNDLNISPAILYMISLSLNIANNYIHHTILIKGDYLLLGLRLKFCTTRVLARNFGPLAAGVFDPIKVNKSETVSFYGTLPKAGFTAFVVGNQYMIQFVFMLLPSKGWILELNPPTVTMKGILWCLNFAIS